MTERINRKSNFELLRILAMIMIVAHHFAVHSGFSYPTGVLIVNSMWVQFLNMWGKVGVNIFVLISGYFLCTCKNLSINKIIKLIVKVWVISVIAFLTYYIVNKDSLSIFEKIKYSITSLFPTTFSQWWFSSTYVFLYLTFPLINVLINSIDRKQHIILLSILTFFLSVIPTFTTLTSFYSNYLWFVYLYLLSSFIRNNESFFEPLKKYWFPVFLIMAMLTFCSYVMLTKMGPFFSEHATYFFEIQKLSTLLISVSCFMCFKNINVPQNRFINVVSSTTFGVYLISDNKFVRPFLWKTLFKNSSFSCSPYLVINSILEVIAVFIVCSLLDLFYQYTVEKLLNKTLKTNRVDGWINKLSSFISQ